jgi:hypothetical protein
MLLDAQLHGLLGDDQLAEQALRNILILTKRKDRWFIFPLKEYKVLVDHAVTVDEEMAFDRLVDYDYLRRHIRQYRVEQKTADLLLKSGRVAHLDWSPTRTCFGRHK